MAPSCPRYSFRLLLPGVLGFGSVRHEPCPTTNFLIIYFRWREGVPTSVLGSSQSFGFSLLPSRVRWPEWGPQVQTSGLHCDPHSFLTVILWRLATVNSNTRIVVILFLSSQWETTWQYGTKKLLPLFVENYYSGPQYEFGDRTEGSKNLSQQKGFATRFLNRTSQEIKPKSNESTNEGTKLKVRKT